MKQLLTITACLGLAALTASADTQVFRSMVGSAANIEQDAAAISRTLKSKNFDSAKVRADIEKIGSQIATLRQHADAFEANAPNLTDAQKKDWELVKTKIQLLTVFHERKSELLSGDLMKNRSMLRAHSDGIAYRAKKLQETVNRLDR
jgi:hypothetical protein